MIDKCILNIFVFNTSINTERINKKRNEKMFIA